MGVGRLLVRRVRRRRRVWGLLRLLNEAVEGDGGGGGGGCGSEVACWGLIDSIRVRLAVLSGTMRSYYSPA